MRRLTTKIARFLLATALVIFIGGCKDDDAAPSKRPLLAGKTWVVTKYELNGADVTDDRDECDTDDTTIFFNDGTFKEDMGALLCDQFDTDVEGTWVFKANETILSLQPSGESASDWKILELSENKLKLSQYVQMLGGEVGVVMEPK